MGMKRVVFNQIVRAKEILGRCRNYVPFKIWHVKYEDFPIVRGSIYINNYGEIQIGKHVSINSGLESSQLGFFPKTILHTSQTGKIIIEDNVGMSNATLYARKLIHLKRNVRLGAGVKIYDNDFHDLYGHSQSGTEEIIPSKEIVIGNNAFVGAGSMILKGVHIGDNAIIGAGSVVARDIPPNEVWAGNPVQFIKEIK